MGGFVARVCAVFVVLWVTACSSSGDSGGSELDTDSGAQSDAGGQQPAAEQDSGDLGGKDGSEPASSGAGDAGAADAALGRDAQAAGGCRALNCGANATCSEAEAGATCACIAGYQDNDGNGACSPACDASTCSGRGSCADGSGTATCACDPGFAGADCSTCAQGYTGTDCSSCDSGFFEYPVGAGSCVDDPCLPDPCNGHGSCDHSSGTAQCTCDAGYAGTDCLSCATGYIQAPLSSGLCIADPCLSFSCGLHGACDSSSGSAVCVCDPHFAGTACDLCAAGYTGGGCSSCDAGYFEFPAGSGACIDDPCQPEACSGHGTCSNSSGLAVCQCAGNFAGADCSQCTGAYTGASCATCASGYYEYPASSGTCVDDPCLPDPCSGHGACSNLTGAAQCTCGAGYGGSSCASCAVGFVEYPAGSGTCIDDPCAPDPCGGHGACSSATGAAVCTCSGHFTGASCSSCASGYTGASCNSCASGYIEFPVGSGTCIADPCQPDPCNGHGTCSNSTGNAVCSCTGNFTGATCSSCVNGYTGADCNTNIDDCSPNPCKNAGTCTDGVASFTCACKGAWDGPTCETIYYGNDANQNLARIANTYGSCSDESFLDLTDWLPDPNTQYTDPTLSVTCTSTTMSVTSNSVPQYRIQWSSPSRTSFANTLVPTTTTYNFPTTTVFNASPKQATVVGGVGVAINGVQVSSPSASGGPLEYADPAEIEVDGDTCEGHPNPSGKYHYHALRTSCLFPEADDGDLRGDPCTAPSPIIAWMADGYPMLGPCECLDAACTQVVEMRSSYVLSGGDNDPSACAYQDYTYAGDPNEYSDGDKFLDECSGHYGPNGDYHYHATNEYPWTLRCYRGTPFTAAPGSAMGNLYNGGTHGSDCCFQKQCIDGVFQSGVSCNPMTCTP